LDLEDAVSSKSKEGAYNNILKLSITNKFFIRIPLDNNLFSKEQIKTLILKFEGRVVLPKIESIQDFNFFIETYNYTYVNSIILLIENPAIFLELPELLTKNANVLKAIGFGSHDFCTSMNMKHESHYLNHYKQQLVLLAAAFEIDYLDGVNINLRNKKEFEQECIIAYEMGAHGKFMIHPNQLTFHLGIDYISDAEISHLKKAYEQIQKKNIEELDIIVVDDKMYEKPHILALRRTINKLIKYHKL